MYKKYFIRVKLFCLLLLMTSLSRAQEQWPRTELAKDGSKVTIYQPQPESLAGNILSGRTAISVKQTSAGEPVFGAIWFTAILQTNRDTHMALLEKLSISNIKLPGLKDTARISKLKTLLETQAPKWKIKVTTDELLSSIEQEQNQTSANLKNDPPKIIYTTTPSVLVTIDGDPKLEQDEKMKMKKVLNSAFLILQYPKDNHFYLYGGKYWYKSSAISTGWVYSKKLPEEITQLDAKIKESEQKDGEKQSSPDSQDSPPAIIISMVPAELIQSKGEANFANISGTELLYVSNSNDDIFKNISDNKYYILLSGRWYSSSSIQGTWTYVDPEKLPPGFSKIPEGSAKDNVLSSVPGTNAARDAVMDAQIPQTAKVDRKEATCTVKYDGNAKFEKIEGTSLLLAVNTSSTVIQADKIYYCIENGVWFKSEAPNGIWKVSDDRPQDVDKIPASNPAYNVKYVYIYDVTPQYIYVGYTPAYMGCYVYGPVVVYGTGFYYSPWYGPYYYPRPVTYGFSVHYNPWTGWSIGFHYSVGFFSFHFYTGRHYGGYWGPHVYRPPYYPRYRGGMYGRGPTHIHGDVNININRSNNIYINNKGVKTNDIKRSGVQPGPNGSQKNMNANNNVLADKQGNVFQYDNKGDLKQRENKSWVPSNSSNKSQLDRDVQNRRRGQSLDNSFNQTNRGGNLGGKDNSVQSKSKKK